MNRSRRWLVPGLCRLSLAVGLMATVGCPSPKEMPGYSKDGQTIALMSGTADEPQLWTVQVQTETTRLHPMPADWRLVYADWIGSQLWVYCSRDLGPKRDSETGRIVTDPKSGKPVHESEYAFSEYDLDADNLKPGPFKPGATPYLSFFDAFVAGHRGREVLHTGPRKLRPETDSPSTMPGTGRPDANRVDGRSYSRYAGAHGG